MLGEKRLESNRVGAPGCQGVNTTELSKQSDQKKHKKKSLKKGPKGVGRKTSYTTPERGDKLNHVGGGKETGGGRLWIDAQLK